MLTTLHAQRLLSWFAPWVMELGPLWVKLVNPPRGPDPFPGRRKDIRIHTDDWDRPYIARGRQGGRDYVRKMYDEHWRHYLGWGDVAFELPNEPDCNSLEPLTALCEFTIGAIEEAAVLGIRLIVFNLPEGNPHDNGTGNVAESAWKLGKLAPAAKLAVERGHIIDLHAYWRPDVEGPTGRWHALGRVKWTLETWITQGVDGSRLRVIVGETGIDGGIAGHPAREGWRKLSNESAYRVEIAEAERYARANLPWVEALCLFTFGWEPPWETFDHYESFARSLIAPLREVGPMTTEPTWPAQPSAALSESWLAEARKHKIPINPDAALNRAIRAAGQERGGPEFYRDGAAWQWGFHEATQIWHLWRWTPTEGVTREHSEPVTR